MLIRKVAHRIFGFGSCLPYWHMQAFLRRRVDAEKSSESSELVSALSALSYAFPGSTCAARCGIHTSIVGCTLGLNQGLLGSMGGLQQEMDAVEVELVELSVASHAVASRLCSASASAAALISETARLRKQSWVAADCKHLTTSVANACQLAPEEEALLNQPANTTLQLRPLLTALAHAMQVVSRGAVLCTSTSLATLGDQVQLQMGLYAERSYAALYRWASTEASHVDAAHPVSYAPLRECLAALSERPLMYREALDEICLGRRALHQSAFVRTLSEEKGSMWSGRMLLTAEGNADGAAAFDEALAKLRLTVGAERQMLRTIFSGGASHSCIQAGGIPTREEPSANNSLPSHAVVALDGVAVHLSAALETCFEQLLLRLRRQAERLLSAPLALSLEGQLRLALNYLIHAHALAQCFDFTPYADADGDVAYAEAAVAASARFGSLGQVPNPTRRGDCTPSKNLDPLRPCHVHPLLTFFPFPQIILELSHVAYASFLKGLAMRIDGTLGAWTRVDTHLSATQAISPLVILLEELLVVHSEAVAEATALGGGGTAAKWGGLLAATLVRRGECMLALLTEGLLRLVSGVGGSPVLAALPSQTRRRLSASAEPAAAARSAGALAATFGNFLRDSHVAEEAQPFDRMQVARPLPAAAGFH